jgi:hypothetical protein
MAVRQSNILAARGKLMNSRYQRSSLLIFYSRRRCHPNGMQIRDIRKHGDEGLTGKIVFGTQGHGQDGMFNDNSYPPRLNTKANELYRSKLPRETPLSYAACLPPSVHFD